MGDILPFVARVRASGDWTASERARLQDLADQFSTGGARVEVVFGTTEDGDPWCVVKDELEEVLVHVARIGGKFVVHYAVEDALEEGVDLHAALSDRLVADAAHDDVVVPFGVGGRHAQTFIALVVAAAFFYETQDVAVAAEADGEPLQMQSAPDDAPSLPAGDDLGVRQDRELTANGSMFADPAPVASAQAVSSSPEEPAPAMGALAAPTAEPAPATVEATQAEAPATESTLMAAAPAAVRNEINGTGHDDLLIGTAGADHIRGGGGADTLQGGGADVGQVDLLDGGEGDDRIELTAQVIATGGEGADTFVIQAPVVMGSASTLLGVLTDFSTGEGDRLVNARGENVTFLHPPSRPAPAGAEPTQNEMAPSLTSPPTTNPDRQLDVDLDGDGNVDGYVIMAHMREPTVYELPTDGASLEEDAFIVVRSVFDYTDFS